MSFTYRLLTNQANILPAAYGLTITATQTGYSPLTVTIPITVTGAVTGIDTVRTISELLSVTWAGGQPARQLTAQDVRDTIVSLALQTGDFSRLPRSASGLAAGRVFVDGEILRVNLPSGAFAASSFITGSGSIFGNARHAIQHATVTLFGAGGLTGTARHAIQHATAGFSGLGSWTATVAETASASSPGVGSLAATTIQIQRGAATLQGGGNWIATAAGPSAQSASASPSGVGSLASIAMQRQRASALFQGSGGLIATGMVSSLAEFTGEFTTEFFAAPASYQQQTASAALINVSTFTAIPGVRYSSRGAMQGAGGLTANAGVLSAGASSFTAEFSAEFT